MANKINWVAGGSGNLVLHGQGFYISYNEHISLDFTGHELKSYPETALVKNGQFFILNGNFMNDYAQIIMHGFPSCFYLYNKYKPHFINIRSADYNDVLPNLDNKGDK